MTQPEVDIFSLSVLWFDRLVQRDQSHSDSLSENKLPHTSRVPAPRGTGTKTVFEEAKTTNFRLLFMHVRDVSVLVSSRLKIFSIYEVPVCTSGLCLLVITCTSRYFPTVVAFDVRRTQPKRNLREAWTRTFSGEKLDFVVGSSIQGQVLDAEIRQSTRPERWTPGRKKLGRWNAHTRSLAQLWCGVGLELVGLFAPDLLSGQEKWRRLAGGRFGFIALYL